MEFNRVGSMCGLFLEGLTRGDYILVFFGLGELGGLGMSRGFCGGCGGDDNDDVVSRV